MNSNFLRLRRQRNNNSNGRTSSISSVSSTSNGSEHAVAAKGGDLLADADSTAFHQSDLPLNNDIAGSKVVLCCFPLNLQTCSILNEFFSQELHFNI